MEMSPNPVSSVWSLWSPWWLLFFLTSILRTTGSAPASPLRDNTTLLLDGGGPGHHLQNCSCSSPVPDCEPALARSLCECWAVPRRALPRAGLRHPGRLAVWVRDSWLLEELLNRSTVAHLHLSLCGSEPVAGRNLVLLGLRSLRVHRAGAPYPRQEMTLLPAPGGAAVGSEASSVSVLDVAVLNGLSALKAYSVVGPVWHHFPQLSVLGSSEEPLHDITFIY